MKDAVGIHLRLREQKIVSALRRVIPGDYDTVTEASDPTLARMGFDFSDARVEESMSKSIPGLFFGETVAERHAPVAGLLRHPGSWTFVLDCHGTGAFSLWLLSVMDWPHRFLEGISDQAGTSGLVLLRKLKTGWMVGIRSTALKEFIKNGRSNQL